MPALLCGIPVPKTSAENGASTVANSDGRLGVAAGMPACAATNSGFVDGVWTIAGGVPASTVVLPTDGVMPRFAPEPSSGTACGVFGTSRLPALSVDAAMNS
jgi:hypothetical protein